MNEIFSYVSLDNNIVLHVYGGYVGKKLSATCTMTPEFTKELAERLLFLVKEVEKEKDGEPS